MTEPILSRRHFNYMPLISLLAAAALQEDTAAAEQGNSPTPTRRDIIRQELPGEPRRDISLIEVTYPPATGSPPHLHANGVIASLFRAASSRKSATSPSRRFMPAMPGGSL